MSSVRPEGQVELGVKIEIKNMNSISGVRRALAYEIERQTAALRAARSSSNPPAAGTMTPGQTFQMRTKESAHDYRYFPDPDLLPVDTRVFMAEVRARRPELPGEKRERFVRDFGVTALRCQRARQRSALAPIISTPPRKARASPRVVANWIINDLLSALAAAGKPITDCPIPPHGFRRPSWT